MDTKGLIRGDMKMGTGERGSLGQIRRRAAQPESAYECMRGLRVSSQLRPPARGPPRSGTWGAAVLNEVLPPSGLVADMVVGVCLESVHYHECQHACFNQEPSSITNTALLNGSDGQQATVPSAKRGGADKHTCSHTTHAQQHTRAQWSKEPRQKQTKKKEEKAGRRSWGGQVERGRGDEGGVGTEGVMYPRDGAPAGPEETGAKAGVLGPGLSLLQQVGCWPFNLSSWVVDGVVVQVGRRLVTRREGRAGIWLRESWSSDF
ncbi:unnamed protein product [Pleuronectes platessa]|uniref:Uncharacterized protein n=1 Tax=Pleuronectes platessa TaxID=8262 RepID=A0A9N7VFT6_PLEPL|nr:unnamed protein product [Pleuronectes platessa]